MGLAARSVFELASCARKIILAKVALLKIRISHLGAGNRKRAAACEIASHFTLINDWPRRRTADGRQDSNAIAIPAGK